ncbi:SDR family NAD(P)-dependent oxidoreductase, partial [Enterococcus faecalis]|uniref:SDR family NAD(P)-dependent oxidoreductase n=1 Tax=Enterococcus faecalis TaxID=1351 RepID=UPI00403EFE55
AALAQGRTVTSGLEELRVKESDRITAMRVALAAAGAHVILVARTARDLEAVEQAIFEAGGQATIAPVDLAEPEAISRLAVAIAGRWDALDILVINAAVLPVLTPVWQIEPRDLNRALTLNVAAT